ncbi:MAG: flagellar hook-basal body protein [Tepidisphaerales bacterium]
MIYGLYRSAAGMMAATYRQSVIANNLANVETVGFKKDLAVVQQRRMAAQELPSAARFHDPFFDRLGGGLLVSPTVTDPTQGTLELTARPLDAALVGEGYFAVERAGETLLTRHGNFSLDSDGRLVLADDPATRVLSRDLRPIVLDPLAPTEINAQGEIVQRGEVVARLAIKSAAMQALEKRPGQTFALRADDAAGQAGGAGGGGVGALPDAPAATVRGGALERSNVDPSTELTAMIEAQRMMEANANLIRFQDQTLGRLVNEVGKV